MKPEEQQDEMWQRLQDSLGNAAESLAKLFTKQPMPKQASKSLSKEFAKELHPGIKRLEKGMSLLLEFLVSPQSFEDDHVREDDFTEHLCQLAAIASVFADKPEQYLTLIATGKTLQEIFGVSDDTLEKLYQAAKYIYEQQHYQESAAAFSVLTIICPNNHIFWLGLGNSEYFSANYEAAVIGYAMAIHANPFDPFPHLFSARCYESMGQKDLAVNSLELALLSIGERQEYASFRQKVTEHKKRLTQKS